MTKIASFTPAQNSAQEARSQAAAVHGYGMAIAALELCYEQMQQCAKIFRDDAGFIGALEDAEIVLRNHGKLS